MDVFRIIDLSPNGEGRATVDLESVVVVLVTRFNYLAECWVLDILDAQEVDILTGIMLFPNIDLLTAHPAIKKLVGSFVLVELKTGDYKDPDLLGIGTRLLWYPPGTEIVLPT